MDDGFYGMGCEDGRDDGDTVWLSISTSWWGEVSAFTRREAVHEHRRRALASTREDCRLQAPSSMKEGCRLQVRVSRKGGCHLQAHASMKEDCRLQVPASTMGDFHLQALASRTEAGPERRPRAPASTMEGCPLRVLASRKAGWSEDCRSVHGTQNTQSNMDDLQVQQ